MVFVILEGLYAHTLYVQCSVLPLTNFTLRIDDETTNKMKKYPVNWSEVARRAINERLELLTRYEPNPSKNFSWRTAGYKDSKITIGAKLGEFGPTDWSLEIRSNKLEKPLTLEFGGMPQLDRIIKGVADYFHHQSLRAKGINLSETISREALSDLWLGVAKWARKHGTNLGANVALLPSKPITVHGRHRKSEFNDTVTPKMWENVEREDDQINVFFSNFWIGSYVHTKGTVFRLSSYLTKDFGISSAKAATRYINFNSNDPRDEVEIKKLISKATVVYLPELSIENVRSIFFPST